MSDHHKSKPEHICVETLDLDKNKPEILKAEIVAESRLFKVEFDLTRPVDAPPVPWGW